MLIDLTLISLEGCRQHTRSSGQAYLEIKPVRRACSACVMMRVRQRQRGSRLTRKFRSCVLSRIFLLSLVSCLPSKTLMLSPSATSSRAANHTNLSTAARTPLPPRNHFKHCFAAELLNTIVDHFLPGRGATTKIFATH